MTTHVFIVDSTTFKLHLEYLFAGTGAKDNKIDFNNNQNTSLHATTENMLIGMIADGSRVRHGDQIIFYLQQEYSKKIFEGKFFGIFKAKNDWSFLDNNDRQQYLKNELEKSQGITTEYPLEGLILRDIVLNNCVLTLAFDDTKNKTVGGACRVGILWFQIEATAKQFPEVKEVRFLPKELFQP